MTTLDRELLALERVLARERLCIDACEDGRTSFFTHVGAASKLVPGPWIAHRELVLSLALANLSPAQRSSLARAVRIEWHREFGVGRSLLEGFPSGLPLGGTSLAIRPRSDGPTCLYTWGLGPQADLPAHEWIVLRAQPEWCEDPAPRALSLRGLETLDQLGGHVLLLVDTATSARQLADFVRGRLRLAAHPRFAPHLDDGDGTSAQVPVLATDANLLVWPHDALDTPSLHRRRVHTVVVIAGDEGVRLAAARWAEQHVEARLDDRAARPARGRTTQPTVGDPGVGRRSRARPGARSQESQAPRGPADGPSEGGLLPGRVEVVHASCPGRLDGDGLLALLTRAGRPKVLLRGDPAWVRAGASRLADAGLIVAARSDGTQLGLW